MDSDSTGDDVAFHDVLGELHSLVLSAPGIESFLDEVASLAAAVFGDEVACGITTRYDSQPLTLAASDDRATIVDEEQYGAGDGPCLEAMRTGRVIEVPDHRADRRWGPYRDAAQAMGVRCSLSLPLFVAEQSVGALNLYHFGRAGAFDVTARQRAEVLATQASTALTLALRFSSQAERSRQLVEALHARSVIDQALGILMAQQSCDARTAFELLRRRSQSANRKLRLVASDVIEHATGQPPVRPLPFEEPPAGGTD
jgi:GAF domain-containing protein